MNNSQVKSHRERPEETERIMDLMRLIPIEGGTVLDIGARDGYIARILTTKFNEVTALDLVKPGFKLPGVITAQGDVTGLMYPDDSFDAVFCAEVLEHIDPHHLADACNEIVRVAKHAIVIGVPYKQDIRVGRTKCNHCGCINPPWGHVNSFNESRLKSLFKDVECISISYVGRIKEKTNALSAFLMDMAGNPWGTYEQEECCIQCGNEITAPESITLVQKIYSKLAVLLTRVQLLFSREVPIWIHMVFIKAAL